jgi:hypothetical protein
MLRSNMIRGGSPDKWRLRAEADTRRGNRSAFYAMCQGGTCEANA